ncbi:WYL domain-containing protein [Glycomyces sp. TRM65418]|nr:WYL domain-containing protein [Glycomyces sp. TRM65418]QZD57806.1 WYL domain-containing protein [Glycomyces sp. TRM65418]
MAKGGRWYLVADELGEPRLLNLRRIDRWEPLDTPRRLRAGARLADVAAALTSGWESAGGLEIRLLVQAHQVERAERMLGNRLSLGARDEHGRTSAVLRCRELEDVRQLLAFADSVTVLDPPEARARLKELASQILRHYG